ncbi:MAG: CTP synthase [Patescibacteria group bacterium]|jgi:CTP synthase|nr:CTP synthase [Patescibacteria group bacterium]
MQTKYIFVTGGVLSGVGKGVTAASLATVLKSKGLKVNIQKCDPYFNVDSGTLNPAEHGEVFVTQDGAETDLDLGHYERFLDSNLTQKSSTMSGRIYRQVIEDERDGKYLGKTVQIIPHVTNAMQEAIISAADGYDVHIVEVGGTVGDYESTAFIEAIRQMHTRVGPENCLYMHVVYLPFISASQEVKSKPAQNAVRDLREAGIRCDILIARADVSVPSGVIKKLSLFSDISLDRVIAMPTVDTVYEVPLILEKQGVADTVCKQLGIKNKPSNIRGWSKLVDQIKKKDSPIVTVGVVAKYLDHTDTYASVVEALKSAAWNNGKQLKIKWIDAEKLNNKNIGSHVMGVQAMVVPGGFGSRGVEGKIIASQYALKNNLPYLGLCLGMQVACIGAVRLSGKKDANSTEFNPKTDNPVIDLMESQKTISGLGGTMRLGNYQCNIIKNSLAHKLYKSTTIYERHRHRYEFNPKYLKDIESVGLTVSGKNPDTGLTEIIEAPKHKYFIASQFHPEFTSRPLRPHPLFDGLIKAAR